ncbi:Apoptosis-inducing factor homolog B [Dictyostelium discoideum] [Rhizoctonia solani]|uniref:Apoptosis-inducing factor homolog B [Dictyostelium discoideum] n=1 Tax=Rhizoctonia solani TaxID=456999 RepID=A0A0K6G4W1_9AGAM|nr:Apoptosis-inducing factor homolog B [Dictyostelium discoideum] [Rhizoctonia solani]
MKNIVVIGAGGGGVPLIQTLQKRLNGQTHLLVVIEQRDYYAHWPSLIRASVTDEGSFALKGLIPYAKAFDPLVNVVRSEVKEITATAVITETGSIPYEHLILATGSIWSGALSLPPARVDALEHLRAFRTKLQAARSILIVGGGAVGVEYAGELRHFLPDKKVTIVHGAPMIINATYPPKFRKSVYSGLTKLGVDVILGDKISPDVTPQDGIVTTEGGKEIEADLVIDATGGQPNTLCLRSLDPDALTTRGTVHVTPELRVKLASGAHNVWAIGDIIEWPEQKMYLKAATGHAPIVAKNVLAAINGSKLTQYKGKAELIMVTLGPKGGRGFAPFMSSMIMGDWMVAKGKSTDLFIPSIQKTLGY